MAKRSFTEHPPRKETVFNPFLEVQKIIGFCIEAARTGNDTFTVFVKDGILHWTANQLNPNRPNKEYPGFITVIDSQKFGNGLTTKQWRKLEERIAIEICKQRKAW